MRHDRSPPSLVAVRNLKRGLSRLWSRRMVLFLWVTLSMTWALVHFIHGARHPGFDKIESLDPHGDMHMNRLVTNAGSRGDKPTIKSEVQSLHWKVDNITSSEEEMLRDILQAAESGSEDYKSSDALHKFWGSVDHAGSEKEEDDKNIFSGKSSQNRKKDDLETQLLQDEVKAFELRRAAREQKPSSIHQTKVSVSDPDKERADSADTQTEVNITVLKKDSPQQKQAARFDSFLALQRSGSEGLQAAEIKAKAADAHSASEAAESRRKEREPWEEPHRRWEQKQPCATVEEMGQATAGDSRKASLRIRKMIREHLDVHGASRLNALPEAEFCRRGFVIAKGQHDGFGNNLYKVFSGAAFALALNRSIVLAETGTKAIPSTHPKYVSQRRRLHFPFSDYIDYSPQLLSVQRLKQLWVSNGCAARHGRPLLMRHESFDQGAKVPLLCQDWASWQEPVIWLSQASDAMAIQWLHKSRHASMRQLATSLLGRPWDPDSRPNLFGELARALLEPNALLQMALNWTLHARSPPDVSIHMRQAIHDISAEAAVQCALKAARRSSHSASLPKVALAADSSIALAKLSAFLQGKARIVRFDHEKFMKEHPDIKVMNASYFAVPKGRQNDWGPFPRWVAVVDFFVAAKAKRAVVSGAGSRVATTFSQLAASLAAAHRLEEDGSDGGFAFYSSFHKGILADGLVSQYGRGYAWTTFGGPLACVGQKKQCALTPLMPYAWFEAPWQSPLKRALKHFHSLGLNMTEKGEVSREAVEGFCRLHQNASRSILELELPECEAVQGCVLK